MRVEGVDRFFRGYSVVITRKIRISTTRSLHFELQNKLIGPRVERGLILDIEALEE